MVDSGFGLLPSTALAAKIMTGCTVIARRDCFVPDKSGQAVPPRNDSRRSNPLKQGKTAYEAACEARESVLSKFWFWRELF
jgi:hypothetical protein